MISCPFCSSAISDDSATFCPHCGRQLGAAPAAPVVQPGETSSKAIASLVLGIPFFLLLPAIAAIVLGHLAMRDIRRSGGRLKGNGLATAGLALGYTGVALIPVVLIVAAIAIPNLLRARMIANEASAIGSLRAVSVASTTYAATYNNGFPPSLAALGPPPGGGNRSTCDYANLIDGVLARGRKAGYVFTYKGMKPRPGGAPGCSSHGFLSFTFNADPVTRATTGLRSFYVDSSGVIRYNQWRTATSSDPPIE